MRRSRIAHRREGRAAGRWRAPRSPAAGDDPVAVAHPHVHLSPAVKRARGPRAPRCTVILAGPYSRSGAGSTLPPRRCARRAARRSRCPAPARRARTRPGRRWARPLRRRSTGRPTDDRRRARAGAPPIEAGCTGGSRSRRLLADATGDELGVLRAEVEDESRMRTGPKRRRAGSHPRRVAPSAICSAGAVGWCRPATLRPRRGRAPRLLPLRRGGRSPTSTPCRPCSRRPPRRAAPHRGPRARPRDRGGGPPASR
jgi:hypothetical protein